MSIAIYVRHEVVYGLYQKVNSTLFDSDEEINMMENELKWIDNDEVEDQDQNGVSKMNCLKKVRWYIINN